MGANTETRRKAQPGRLTLDNFIARAQAIHGMKYDYSQVELVNTKTKVKIICPIHGEFLQTPDKHLSGNGCPHKDCVTARRKATNKSKYGVEHALQAKQFLDKQQATNMARRGVKNVMQAVEVRQKHDDTCMRKYGAATPLGNPDVQVQVQAARAKNSSSRTKLVGFDDSVSITPNMPAFQVSRDVIDDLLAFSLDKNISPVDFMELILIRVFGSSDVQRLAGGRGFRILSRDLYIDMLYGQEHGGHWFDMNDADDAKKLSEAHVRLVFDDGKIDLNSERLLLNIWAGSDVKLREDLKNIKANHVVFWDAGLRDAVLWFSMNCPDGQDWKEIYSWLPKREIRNHLSRPELTGTRKNLTQIAKYYQFDVFYQHEIQLWHDNAIYRGLPLQVYLYHNRLKYIGKNPIEISDFELARGFKIAGIFKGYTAFDASLMQQVLDKYDIKSVFDPCAGWGERLLCCASRNIDYIGMDINRDLQMGYENLIRDLALSQQHVIFDDAAVPPGLQVNFDAVISCPPYWNTEIYSAAGAENYDYQDFLNWWRDVVEFCENSSSIKYFCFQINQKYRDDMLAVCIGEGWNYIDELYYATNPSSHFTKPGGNNTKKEFESMLILGR